MGDFAQSPNRHLKSGEKFRKNTGQPVSQETVGSWLSWFLGLFCKAHRLRNRNL